jgi:hypothetical protein
VCARIKVRKYIIQTSCNANPNNINNPAAHQAKRVNEVNRCGPRGTLAQCQNALNIARNKHIATQNLQEGDPKRVQAESKFERYTLLYNRKLLNNNDNNNNDNNNDGSNHSNHSNHGGNNNNSHHSQHQSNNNNNSKSKSRSRIRSRSRRINNNLNKEDDLVNGLLNNSNYFNENYGEANNSGPIFSSNKSSRKKSNPNVGFNYFDNKSNKSNNLSNFNLFGNKSNKSYKSGESSNYGLKSDRGGDYFNPKYIKNPYYNKEKYPGRANMYKDGVPKAEKNRKKKK